MADLAFLAKSHQYILKFRLSIESRRRDLKNKGKMLGHDWLFDRATSIEHDLELEIAKEFKTHLLYEDLSKIKGLGQELGAKLIGFIECVEQEEENRNGIACFDTLSRLWTFCGYGLPKQKVAGEKLNYNPELKAHLWKIASSFLKHKNRFYEKIYLTEKARQESKFGSVVKAAKGKKLAENEITVLHVHNRALRKMTKVFLGCLYYRWRELENLPCRPTYAEEHLGHTTRYALSDFMDNSK